MLRFAAAFKGVFDVRFADFVGRLLGDNRFPPPDGRGSE